MKRMLDALVAFFLAIPVFAGSISFEKIAFDVPLYLPPSTSTEVFRFDIVAGKGGGILNSFRVRTRGETAPIVGLQLLDYGTGTAVPIGKVLSLQGETNYSLWFDVNATLPPDKHYPLGIVLTTGANIRQYDWKSVTLEIDMADVGNDDLTGWVIRTSSLIFRDPTPWLWSEKVGSGFLFEYHSEPNSTYVIEESSDLKTWNTLGAFVTDERGGGSHTFLRTNGLRFFRTVTYDELFGYLRAVSSSRTPAIHLRSRGTAMVDMVFSIRSNKEIDLTELSFKVQAEAPSDPILSPLSALFSRFILTSEGRIVGTGILIGTNDIVRVRLDPPIRIPENQQVEMAIGSEVADAISAFGAGVWVRISVLGETLRGTVVENGKEVRGGAGSIPSELFAAHQSMPTLRTIPLSSDDLHLGRHDWLRFSVSANPSGDIELGRITTIVDHPDVEIADVRLYSYTDAAFTTPVVGVEADGAWKAKLTLPYGKSGIAVLNEPGSNRFVIPAGQTYYFALRGTVLKTLRTKPFLQTWLHNNDGAFAGEGVDPWFLWSSKPGSDMWANGYAVSGIRTTRSTLIP